MSVLTDKVGVTFGWTADGANHNDSVLLAPSLEDAERRGLTQEIKNHLARPCLRLRGGASSPHRGEDR
jgi:hypothetical protein